MTPRRRSSRRFPGACLASVSALFRGSVGSHGIALMLGAGLVLGCGSEGGAAEEPPPPGGQTGEETVGCQPVERDMLAWSERSTLGFSADELLNTLGGEGEARLAWSGGGSTALTLGIERAASGSVEFQTRAYVNDGSGAEPAREIAAPCNDVVAVPVTLSFTTSDGAFAEEWPLTLLAESATRVSAYSQVEIDDLEGTFEVSQVDTGRFDRVLAIVDLRFADGEWTGALSGQGITSGSSNPDTATSATHFAIAAF